MLGRFTRGHITFVPDLSRQISTFECCCAYRKTFGSDCGRWKLALPTKTRSRHQMALWKYAAFSLAQTGARRGTAPQYDLCCAFPGIVWNYQGVFPFSCRAIPFGAKMLRVLFFLGYLWWTFMNVARQDIIISIKFITYHYISLRTSGLVGNPWVVNFASTGHIMKSYQDLPPSLNMPGSVGFGNQNHNGGALFSRGNHK